MSRHRLRLWAYMSAATLVGLAVSMAVAGQDPFQQPQKSESESVGKTDEKSSEPEFVRKTDEEWRKILSPAEYMVTRLKETEPAFTGKYASGHFRGTFHCVGCGAALFSAQHKFESGTGWPSFWRPVDPKAIQRAFDNSEAEPRIEVTCRRCGAHLGHVFDDGPPPTGLRFCINSVALKLRPPAGNP